VIAVAKWIGTLAPTIVFGVLRDSSFILGLGILCSIFDVAYIAILLAAQRNPTPTQVAASAWRGQASFTG
jgi:hypothetical protein